MVGPHWCQKHNVERLDRISANLATMEERARFSRMVDEALELWRRVAAEALAEKRAMVVAAGGTLTVRPEHRTHQGSGEGSSNHPDGSTTYRVY